MSLMTKKYNKQFNAVIQTKTTNTFDVEIKKKQV